MFIRIVGLASVAVVISASGLAAASPKCAAGERPTIDGCRSGTAALGTHPVAAPAPQPAAKTPPKPDETLRPDQSLLQAADRRLLVEEIARLERLVAAMPRKAPDRALMVRRLGDDYADLVRIEEREYLSRDQVAEALRRELEASDRAAAPKVPVTVPHRPIRM